MVTFQDLTLDEERRHKRRERNKVAATKCRNKKKEQTAILEAEGKEVERQNSNLKQNILRLEAEEKHLRSILHQHQPMCAKRLKSEQEFSNYLRNDVIDLKEITTTTRSNLNDNNESFIPDQDFHSFAENIDWTSEAITDIDNEENGDLAQHETWGKEDIVMKEEESLNSCSYFVTDIEWKDSNDSNYRYYNNDSGGSTYRFLGVDSRFIVL